LKTSRMRWVGEERSDSLLVLRVEAAEGARVRLAGAAVDGDIWS
jgi:hypothetical protein